MTNPIVSLKRSRRGKAAEYAHEEESHGAATNAPESPHVGKQLLILLWQKMGEREETTKELATNLGIAYPYLMALARNERPVHQLSREVLKNAAKYLGLPVAQAYILAGALDPTDFFYEERIHKEIEDVYKDSLGNPDWSGHTPPRADWDTSPQSVKLYASMLYESATTKKLMTYASLELPKIS